MAEDSTLKPLVLFGGTFSPIHQGHLLPVISAAESVSPAKLIYLPCYLPPHKAAPGVSSLHRFNMAQLALQQFTENIRFELEVSDFELKQKGHSYTLNTVQHFKSLHRDQTIYFLIGMDSLLTFHLWHKWQHIFNYCDLLVIKRPQYPLNDFDDLDSELVNRFMSQVHFVEINEVNISSTEIRKQIQLGQVPKQLPDIVFNYINNNGLYL